MQSNSFELFSKSGIAQGLSPREIKELFSSTTEISLAPGDYLVKEGDLNRNLFIVLEGSFEVCRYDEELKEEFRAKYVGPGDMIGEISFLDQGSSEISIRAKTEATLRSISSEKLKDLFGQNVDFLPIYYRINSNIAKKFRYWNEIFRNSINTEIENYQIRTHLSVLLVYFLVGMSACNFAIPGILYLIKTLSNSSYITAPLIFSGMLISFICIWKWKWSLKEVGITTERWKRSVYEGLVYTIPLGIIFCGGMKWILIHMEIYRGHPLIEPFAYTSDVSIQTWGNWIILNSFYSFILVPMQELFIRGVLQGFLEKALVGKQSILFANLIASLYFSSIHVIFSPYFAVAVFLGGIYFGWIYSRTHNLIGCCIAHAILGVLSLSVFGLVNM